MTSKDLYLSDLGSLLAIANPMTIEAADHLHSLAFHGHAAVHFVLVIGYHAFSGHLSAWIRTHHGPGDAVAFCDDVLGYALLIGFFISGDRLIFFDALGKCAGRHFHGHALDLNINRDFPLAFI